MTNWRPEFNPEHLYFVTTTAVGHLHIFQRDLIKRIVVEGLYHIRTADKNKLYSFVIMPNHVHFIIQCRVEGPLKDVLRDFKANTTNLIVRQLTAEGDHNMLTILAGVVERKDKQEYQVWDAGYLAKEVFTPEFLRQKIKYIHHNPLQDHWQLAKTPEEYVWSSARFYYLDELALISLDDARELF
jgi:REP element-mobilizing transposase RayT